MAREIEHWVKQETKIKCIALDMDRTTLNRDGKLSEGNRKALEQAIAAGIHVIIASGRAFDTLPEDVLAVPGIEYAITSNGAAMYHVPDGKCLKRHQLGADAVEAIMKATKSESVTYEAFINGIAYADKAYVEEPARFDAPPEAVAYVKATRHILDDIKKFIEENKHHLDSMDVIVKDKEANEKVWEQIKNATDEVYITSSFAQLVEIADKNAGKKSGVAFFMELLGLKREEIAAFGDADNDADMLRFAGCGVAMENASEGCREAADYITKHHDEDGLAYGIRYILKQNEG